MQWYLVYYILCYVHPFFPNVPFKPFRKTSELLWFFVVFRGMKKGTMERNELLNFKTYYHQTAFCWIFWALYGFFYVAITSVFFLAIILYKIFVIFVLFRQNILRKAGFSTLPRLIAAGVVGGGGSYSRVGLVKFVQIVKSCEELWDLSWVKLL